MKIALANSRLSKTWTNKEISWDELIARLSTTQKTVETIEEFLKMKLYSISSDEKAQIWAEAKYYYEQGEKLFIDEDNLLGEAISIQRSALEDDDRRGMVEDYLNKLLPDNWSEMDVFERKNYLSEYDNPATRKGTVQRETVSNIEIWTECFGKNPSDMKKIDSYSISVIMTKIDGWKKTNERLRIPLYGQQRVYRREN